MEALLLHQFKQIYFGNLNYVYKKMDTNLNTYSNSVQNQGDWFFIKKFFGTSSIVQFIVH